VNKKLADIFDEKTMASIARAFARISEDYKIDEAYLFGSYAEGRQTEKSDIDIAIISDAIKGSQDAQNIYLRVQACNPKIHVFSRNKEVFHSREGGFTDTVKAGIPIDVAEVLGLPKLKKPDIVKHGKTKVD
jgi:predicted nucleotidyltransferase